MSIMPLNFSKKNDFLLYLRGLYTTKMWFLFPPSQSETLGLRIKFVDVDFWYFHSLQNGIWIRVRIRIFGQIRIRDSNPRKNESLTNLIGGLLKFLNFWKVILLILKSYNNNFDLLLTHFSPLNAK